MGTSGFTAFALAAFVFAVGLAAGQPLALPVPDERVSASTFALFPWDNLDTPELLKEAYDCGFNLSGFSSKDNLDAVHAAGLQCFIYDPLLEMRGLRLYLMRR